MVETERSRCAIIGATVDLAVEWRRSSCYRTKNFALGIGDKKRMVLVFLESTRNSAGAQVKKDYKYNNQPIGYGEM